MLSSMFDFPLPFKPVMALNNGSNPFTSVRFAYDLKPSKTIPLMYMFIYLQSKRAIKRKSTGIVDF